VVAMSDTPRLTRPAVGDGGDDPGRARPRRPIRVARGREAAALVRPGAPLVLTGCGTSEHAAMAGAALLGGLSRRLRGEPDPQPAAC
jgi:hypothetical protein